MTGTIAYAHTHCHTDFLTHSLIRACSMSRLIAELATNSIMGLKYALELRDQLIEKSQKLNLAGSVGLLQGLRKHGINGIIFTYRLIHLLIYLLTH